MTEAANPDRRATTLAERAVLLTQEPAIRAATARRRPGIATDARADLHLLRHRTQRAVRDGGNEAAMALLADLDSDDLLAGTIQDGTARGLMARLEEAISLCDPQPAAAPSVDEIADDPHTVTFSAKDLRRKRDILVASGGARIRFSRRAGCHLIDRRLGIHEEHCIQFEDRSDGGCLDGFEPIATERARLFSPAFLRPAYLHQGKLEDRLVLAGQLGRGRQGHPCRVTLVGRKNETGIRMSVWILNRHGDHRLRIRFVGLQQADYVSHRGTPGFERVHVHGRTFLAATLLRACGRLRVGDDYIATPAAQLLGPIEHEFGLGIEV